MSCSREPPGPRMSSGSLIPFRRECWRSHLICSAGVSSIWEGDFEQLLFLVLRPQWGQKLVVIIECGRYPPLLFFGLWSGGWSWSSVVLPGGNCSSLLNPEPHIYTHLSDKHTWPGRWGNNLSLDFWDRISKGTESYIII